MNNGMWDKALGDIYRQSMINKHWIMPIFMVSLNIRRKTNVVKKVIKNILVILTDGYIYYKDNAEAKAIFIPILLPKH